MSAVADMCVDLVVIGGGPGGYTAALRGAQAGLKTILINGDELGGCCLNYGCIPSKAFIHSAKLYRQIESSKQFGVMVDGVSLDFSRVQTWKNRVMRRLQRGLQTLLDGVGVQIVNGTATLTGAETLSVNESQGGLVKIMFAHAVIAVGSRPRRLTDFKNSNFSETLEVHWSQKTFRNFLILSKLNARKIWSKKSSPLFVGIPRYSLPT